MPKPKTGEPEKLSSFYDDLEKLLLSQLKAHPELPDLRLRLIELYFETGRKEPFIQEAHKLSRKIQDRAHSREWQKVVSLGRLLAPAEALFSEVGSSVEFVESAAKAAPKIRRFGDDKIYVKQFEGLAKAYEAARGDPKFFAEFDMELIRIAGRPSTMQHAARLSESCGGGQIYFKREDLSPIGSHMMISVLGQALLARRLGLKTMVAATVNGHKGVIAASVAARLGLACQVYMDSADMSRQPSNVFRMWLLGAQVNTVESKAYRDGDVREAALDHWRRDTRDSFLVVGLDAAPQPYPMMNREFIAIIGRECRRQILSHAKRLPDVMVARGGDNADAIGFFQPFLTESNTRLVCVNVRKEFSSATAKRDEEMRRQNNLYNPALAPMTDQAKKVASGILEGLEYPSVTREHAWLKASGRVEYVDVSDNDSKEAISQCGRLEGIIPAIQTAQVIAWTCLAARGLKPEQAIVAVLAENVDKDLWEIGKVMGVAL